MYRSFTDACAMCIQKIHSSFKNHKNWRNAQRHFLRRKPPFFSGALDEEHVWNLDGALMLTAALPALERANLDADFLEALAELYPTCEAFYFQNCGKLFLAEDVRSHQIEGPDRFIRFGVNVRFFNIEGTEDMLIDTVGMSTLFLPDLQYHFHGMDPNWVVNHAYNVASYILEHDNPIQDGETIDGVADGQMCREIQWKCQYEDALIQPPRGVLDINMGKYASGGR